MAILFHSSRVGNKEDAMVILAFLSMSRFVFSVLGTDGDGLIGRWNSTWIYKTPLIILFRFIFLWVEDHLFKRSNHFFSPRLKSTQKPKQMPWSCAALWRSQVLLLLLGSSVRFLKGVTIGKKSRRFFGLCVVSSLVVSCFYVVWRIQFDRSNRTGLL